MKDLTIKQWMVFEFIERYIKDNGYAPTLLEIAAGVGQAEGSIQFQVNALVKKGKLIKTAGKARALSVVKDEEPKHIVEPGHVVIGNRTIKVGIPGTEIVRVK